MSKLHPIFQNITDGFLSIHKKVEAAASVSGIPSGASTGGPEATPDNAGNHRSLAYRPSQDELDRSDAQAERIEIFRREY